jgi:serine/threonine protein kinase
MLSSSSSAYDQCASTNNNNNIRLSWSQSVDDRANASRDSFATQQDVLTQDCCSSLTQQTQMELSPLSPYRNTNNNNSPPTHQPPPPWGRLLPLKSSATNVAVDLLPCATNTYTLGRSAKCSIPIQETIIADDPIMQSRHDWAYGMISNKHCKLFLEPNDNQVYIQDTSGNGTVINQTTLLQRGEQQCLVAGDEIGLIRADLLRKKIRHTATRDELVQYYSYIFVPTTNATTNTTAINTTNTIMSPPPARRNCAVQARATQQHSTTTGAVHSDGRRLDDDYDVLPQVLGAGTVGLVQRAIHRRTGRAFAVKIIPTARPQWNSSGNTAATIQTEAALLQTLEHPYVVRLKDTYVAHDAVYLVMELLQGGDLFDRIVLVGKYKETESRRVLRRLLAAVYYLHEECNIVHRDLKPENVLLVSRDDNVDLKLTDFGLAHGAEGCKTFCGTPMYFAPEILQRRHTVHGQGRYGKAADMWSLGIILYVLLSGTPPYEPGMGIDFVATIDFPDEFWAGISDQAKDFIKRLLVIEPSQRLTVRAACDHAWLAVHDGDTHTHPLDDPRLTVQQKRLFDAVKKSDVAGETNLNEAEKVNMEAAVGCAPDESKTTTDRFRKDCDRDVPKDDSQILNGTEPKPEAMLHINEATAEKTDHATETKPKAAKISLLFEQPCSVLRSVVDTPSSNLSSDLVSPVAKDDVWKENVASTDDGASQPTKAFRSTLANAATISTTNAKSYTKLTTSRNENEMIVLQEQKGAVDRLNDDETISQFSENTESISSFESKESLSSIQPPEQSGGDRTRQNDTLKGSDAPDKDRLTSKEKRRRVSNEASGAKTRKRPTVALKGQQVEAKAQKKTVKKKACTESPVNIALKRQTTLSTFFAKRA